MTHGPLQQVSTIPWFLVSTPKTRGDDLVRHTLFTKLDESVGAFPITIVKAPSGFGKTTSLALWAEQRTNPTAWITLGRGSRTTIQLISYLMASLLRIFPDSQDLDKVLVSIQDNPDHISTVIEAIIDAVPADIQTTIVIDEAQESSQEALTSLIVPIARYSGGRIRFVLSGTRSLSSWLTKELAKAEAHHLDSNSLLFSRDEIAELLSGQADPEAWSPEKLWQETGGWPVAIHLLLTIGAGTRSPAHLPATTAPMILTDYIESEVLSTLSDDLRQFVLDATISDRLTPKLASWITDNPLAPALLERCRRSGLFLDHFQDDSGAVLYRWHDTFARACRTIAQAANPERVKHLHQRAAELLADQFPSEALLQAIGSGDNDFAVRMVEEVWLQMVTSGRWVTLEERCLQLPSTCSEHPSILFIRAVCRNMADDHGSAGMLRNRAQVALAHLAGVEYERAVVSKVFSNLMVLADHGELNTNLNSAEDMLSSSQLTRSQQIHGTFLAGWTRIRLRRNPHRAIELLHTAASGAKDAGYENLARRAQAITAFGLAFAGQLNAARSLLEDLSQGEQSVYDPFDGTINYWTSLFIAYWQGDMARVMADARKLNDTKSTVSSNAGMGRIYFACAAALVGQDYLDEADEMLTQVSDEIQHGLPWPAYKAVSIASLAWARNDATGAVRALESIGDHAGITTTLAMAADMWRRLGHPDRAFETLTRIDNNQLTSYTATSMAFTRAIIAWDRGRTKQAHEILESCLDLAVPESVSAPFVMLNDSARNFLAAHLTRGTRHEEFVAEKLSADAALHTAPAEPTEPLSVREVEVLSYLGSTMTAVEIADKLYLSPATIRTHQRSIYRKLGVKNRRDAVRAGYKLTR